MLHDDVRIAIRSLANSPGYFMALALTFGLAMAASSAIFSAVSLNASRRYKEFGLRLALGAGSSEIARTVVDAARAPVLAGLSAGLALAVAGTRLMTHLLFGVDPLDAVTYAAVVCLAALSVAAAGSLPVYRATRIDPATALRRD